MKFDREKIHAKYNGRCAYCGVKIDIRSMQVDHHWPQFLAHFEPDKDNNRDENLLPSCRKCNNFKGGMRLEDFREELSKQVERLKKNAQFDRALRFGQVEICETPIVFYFESEER
jgi:5-methylcytosine-specific restriction endonuclease McrA